jgi:hypothetical protein
MCLSHIVSRINQLSLYHLYLAKGISWTRFHKVLKISLCYEFAWFSVRQTLKSITCMIDCRSYITRICLFSCVTRIGSYNNCRSRLTVPSDSKICRHLWLRFGTMNNPPSVTRQSNTLLFSFGGTLSESIFLIGSKELTSQNAFFLLSNNMQQNFRHI